MRTRSCSGSCATANYLAAVDLDGSGLRRVMRDPINEKFGVSPSGEWVAVYVPHRTVADAGGTVAVSTRTGESTLVSRDYCPSAWSSDGTLFYTSDSLRTFAIPLAHDKSLPYLPPDGLIVSGMPDVPGVQIINHEPIAHGRDASTYAFVKVDQQRNLFRIPLH